MNKQVTEKLAEVRNAMLDERKSIVLKADDFNKVQIRGLPASANSSKFSKALTTANLALKFHRTPRLKLGEYVKLPNGSLECKSWVSHIHQDISVAIIYGRSINAANPTFFALRELDQPAVKALYKFSTATAAGSLKEFYIFASLENPMKKLSEMRQIVKFMVEYADNYLSKNTAVIVGDFYVWKNTLRVLATAKEGSPLQSYRRMLLPWPDAMHIGLNAQEALIKWGHTLLLPIWLSGFPDATFTPFHVRPIRRVAILTFMLLGWRDVRSHVLSLLTSAGKFDSFCHRLN